MHTLSSRFNTVILYTATVLGAMCVLNMLTGFYLFNPQPDIDFQVVEISKFKYLSNNRWEELNFKFNLRANLSSLYNWNLKQLYFYLEAEYENPINKLKSQSILYDTIIQLPEDRTQINEKFVVELSNQKLQYPLRDVYSKLRGQNIKLKWIVEYMPITGYFFKHTLYETTYQLPKEYV